MGLVVLWLLVMLGSSVACGAIAGNIAAKRGASYGTYFALGFFLGLIGVIAAAFAGGGSNRSVTVINNYYAVNPDGTHTALGMSPAGLGPARAPLVAGAASRTCVTPGCAANGRPTLNDRCLACHESTRAMPPSSRVLHGAPVRPGPRAVENRHCADAGCERHGLATSNLMCQACRRDTSPGLFRAPTTAVHAAPPPIRAIGPGHLLTRRCPHPECAESVSLTSDLVCRSCRRDTATVAAG